MIDPRFKTAVVLMALVGATDYHRHQSMSSGDQPLWATISGRHNGRCRGRLYTRDDARAKRKRLAKRRFHAGR